MTHRLNSPPLLKALRVDVFHRLQGAIHDPSADGPIASIDYREDRIEFSGREVRAALALEQDGTIFVVGRDIPAGRRTWSTWSATGLTAGDFSRDPGFHRRPTARDTVPDFVDGGPIQFGYVRANFTSEAAGVTTMHGIDNWRLILHR